MAQFVIGRLILVNKSVYIIVSAIGFASAFFCPDYVWWLVFVYLVPLFYCAIRFGITWLDGFIWGSIVYQLHFIVLFDYFWQHTCGSCLRLFAPIVLVVYFALYSGLWFLLMGHVVKKTYNFIIYILAFLLLTLLYIWFMYEGVFWIFERWYGYCFTLPLLPLMSRGSLLSHMSTIGIWLYICALVMVQGSIVCFLLSKKAWYLIVAGVSLLPFVCGFFSHGGIEQRTPDSFKSVGHVSVEQIKSISPHQWALAINDAIETYCTQNPKKDVLVMQETAFPFALNEHSRVVRLWSENALNNDKHLIIGAGRTCNGKRYNSLFHIHKGLIINHYDKRHLFPFTEYQTFKNKLWQIACARLWPDSLCCSPGSINPPIFECGNFKCAPQICSDIFLGHAHDIKNLKGDGKPIPLLCVYNDQMFSMYYAQRLIQLYILMIINLN